MISATTNIEAIARAFAKGDVARASKIREGMGEVDIGTQAEILEVARQAIISFLKRGEIYKARETEMAFDLEQDVIDETVRQAFLSSFREGNMDILAELRDGLPIERSLAQELLEYSASWGEPSFARMKAVLA